VALSPSDWLYCTAVASSVLWLREITKAIVLRASRPRLLPERLLKRIGAGNRIIQLLWRRDSLRDVQANQQVFPRIASDSMRG
jgi:hypothetical protein